MPAVAAGYHGGHGHHIVSAITKRFDSAHQALAALSSCMETLEIPEVQDQIDAAVSRMPPEVAREETKLFVYRALGHTAELHGFIKESAGIQSMLMGIAESSAIAYDDEVGDVLRSGSALIQTIMYAKIPAGHWQELVHEVHGEVAKLMARSGARSATPPPMHVDANDDAQWSRVRMFTCPSCGGQQEDEEGSVRFCGRCGCDSHAFAAASPPLSVSVPSPPPMPVGGVHSRGNSHEEAAKPPSPSPTRALGVAMDGPMASRGAGLGGASKWAALRGGVEPGANDGPPKDFASVALAAARKNVSDTRADTLAARKSAYDPQATREKLRELLAQKRAERAALMGSAGTSLEERLAARRSQIATPKAITPTTVITPSTIAEQRQRSLSPQPAGGSPSAGGSPVHAKTGKLSLALELVPNPDLEAARATAEEAVANFVFAEAERHREATAAALRHDQQERLDMLRRQEQERPRLVKGTPVIVVNFPEHGHVEGIITGTSGAGVSMQVFVKTLEGKQLKYPVKHIVINEEALAANGGALSTTPKGGLLSSRRNPLKGILPGSRKTGSRKSTPLSSPSELGKPESPESPRTSAGENQQNERPPEEPAEEVLMWNPPKPMSLQDLSPPTPAPEEAEEQEEEEEEATDDRGGVPRHVKHLDAQWLGELVASTLDFLTRQEGTVPTTKKVIDSAQVVLTKLGCKGDLNDKRLEIDNIIDELLDAPDDDDVDA